MIIPFFSLIMLFYFIRWNASGKDQSSNNKRPQSAVFHGSKKGRKKFILNLYLWFLNTVSLDSCNRVESVALWGCRCTQDFCTQDWKDRAHNCPELEDQARGRRGRGAAAVACSGRLLSGRDRRGRLGQPETRPWTLLRKGSPTQWFQPQNRSLQPPPQGPVFTPTSSSRGEGLWFSWPHSWDSGQDTGWSPRGWGMGHRGWVKAVVYGLCSFHHLPLEHADKFSNTKSRYLPRKIKSST